MIKFSIVTGTYNQLKLGFLPKMIESVRHQSGLGEDFEYEHIIIDDGSTDDTHKLLSIEAERDPRLRVIIKKTNEGIDKVWRDGIMMAKGGYVIFLDDDDILPKDSLQKRAEFAKKNSGLDWFYGLSRTINENGKILTERWQSEEVLHKKFPYEELLLGNYIHGGTPTIKTGAAKSIKFPDFYVRAQDYFFWLELMRPERKLKVGFINDYLYERRIHKDMDTLRYEDKANYLWRLGLANQFRDLHPANLAFMAKEYRKLKMENKFLRKSLDELLDKKKRG